MKGRPQMPAEALADLYDVYGKLGPQLEQSLAATMAVHVKHGKPNGSAILPWAQVVGASVGHLLEQFGLTDADLVEISKLVAEAVLNGVKMTREVRHMQKFGTPPTSDPTLN